MIDIHAHCLPVFDDGVPGIDTTVNMAKIAEKFGMTAIIATPHCYDGSYTCPREDNLLGNFAKSVDMFSQWLVGEEKIHHLASDCHMPLKRTPKLRRANSMLLELSGPDFAKNIHEECGNLLC